ncbi:hypothetical protein LCGC14_1087250 [marine sediment metagenome]|uniref:Uncharacterized protein n=1 Tax=marine sediment metagenome TaxID=412755 RepID=A0A0F9QJG6_9ZZZZ
MKIGVIPSDVLIQECLNTFLKEQRINLSTYTNLEFIVKINNFLTTFPSNFACDYSWKRKGSQFKPVLYLHDINKIIRYNVPKNCFISKNPSNLDLFLK